jgi:hypothetical protein
MAMVFLNRKKALFLLVIVLCLPGCARFLFFPSNDIVRTPADVNIAYQDVYFPSADGTILHGWYLPASGDPKGSFLFAHGNAENISTHLASVYWLPSKGYNVFLFDYRGYGLSEGVPSLEGAVQDFDAALKTLLQRYEKNKTKHIIVFGQSLGGALAIYSTATSHYNGSVDVIIVESTFASYRDIAQDKFAGFFLTWPLQWPLALLFPDKMSPVNVVSELAPIPLLVVHGDADQIVPIKHGKALFDAAKEPKELWVIEGGRHISTFRSKANRQKLLDYLQQVLPKS